MDDITPRSWRSRHRPWIPMVWWSLMVLLTAAIAASVVQAAFLASDGSPVAAALSLVVAVGLGIIVGREWLHWREMTGFSG